MALHMGRRNAVCRRACGTARRPVCSCERCLCAACVRGVLRCAGMRGRRAKLCTPRCCSRRSWWVQGGLGRGWLRLLFAAATDGAVALCAFCAALDVWRLKCACIPSCCTRSIAAPTTGPPWCMQVRRFILDREIEAPDRFQVIVRLWMTSGTVCSDISCACSRMYNSTYAQ